MKYLLMISFLFPSAFTNGLFAQAGELDYSFSEDGMTTTSFGFTYTYTIARSIAIQSNGKIVVAGNTDNGTCKFALAAYDSDGTLDNSFGGDGIINSDFDAYGYSVAIQPDGKIVVAGALCSLNPDNYSFALARYNTDGMPDYSFSGDGLSTTTDFGFENAYARSVAIQSDGKIVVAGYSFDDNSTSSNFALARYNTDGTLDITFSGDGITTTHFGTFDIAYSLAIQSDGKIVVAGDSGSQPYLVLARYNTDGTLDNSFSGDGFITNSDIYVFSVVIQPDGKIVVAGNSPDSFSSDFSLARYNTDGTLDNSFSDDGITTTDLGSESDFAVSVAIQSDGKIVVAGYSYSNGSDLNFAVARYNTDGTLDYSFSGDGISTTDFDSHNDHANSVAIQSDGKIVVAGSSYNENNNSSQFAVARYFSGLETNTDNDNNSSNQVIIYPNPSNEYIIIEGDYTDNTEIINTLGQSVPARIENSKIDIRWLPDGAYLLKTETKDHRFTISKFIKRKT